MTAETQPSAPFIAGQPKDVRTIGVVVPAHNEQELLPSCLQALKTAARHPELGDVVTRILVVLDRCTDESEAACRGQAVHTLRLTARSVGQARARGFAAMITELSASPDVGTTERGSTEEDSGTVWLASTDADTQVAPDWLAQQLRLAREGADAIFGVVDIEDWSEHPLGASSHFADLYDGTANGLTTSHRHVHGANMGFSREAYLQAGGISDRIVGEDQALSDLMAVMNLRVMRTTSVRVTTSARRTARIRGGFADFLCGLAGPTDTAVQ